MHYLYCITNLMNGKVYIGQTKRPSSRWYQHRARSAQPKYPLHHAMKKYGSHNFNFEVLAAARSYADADILEIQLIRQYNSLCPYGYNIAGGGRNGSKNQGTRCAKAKLSELEVINLVNEYNTSDVSTRELALKYGIGKSAVFAIISGAAWSHLNLTINRKDRNDFIRSPKHRKQQSQRSKGNKSTTGYTWMTENGKRIFKRKN